MIRQRWTFITRKLKKLDGSDREKFFKILWRLEWHLSEKISTQNSKVRKIIFDKFSFLNNLLKSILFYFVAL